MRTKKQKIDAGKLLFSNHDLKVLLIPLMVEQLLNSLMGTVDSMMVSNVGSAAISAVSLVDSINVLVIQVFTALTAGGAIICSQCLGRKDVKAAIRQPSGIAVNVSHFHWINGSMYSLSSSVAAADFR